MSLKLYAEWFFKTAYYQTLVIFWKVVLKTCDMWTLLKSKIR